jgi:mono/diheme cytochrome c family protein
MKKNSVIFLGSVGLLFCVATLFSFIVPQDQKTAGPWEIPAKYKEMKNTFKGDAASEKLGKILYTKHCKSCHGNLGEGNGPKAASMKTKLGTFKDAKFQAQTDGEIYYQAIIGRDEMPAFDKKILEDEDRWAIVNYIRALK